MLSKNVNHKDYRTATKLRLTSIREYMGQFKAAGTSSHNTSMEVVDKSDAILESDETKLDSRLNSEYSVQLPKINETLSKEAKASLKLLDVRSRKIKSIRKGSNRK
mmetsp:Transcript_26468/g.30595  ORF Transcript_26468/g.30595 Transcript_26468/m.30595 type:complete len:106 (-) Transcript_26468:113-430(-)